MGVECRRHSPSLRSGKRSRPGGRVGPFAPWFWATAHSWSRTLGRVSHAARHSPGCRIGAMDPSFPEALKCLLLECFQSAANTPRFAGGDPNHTLLKELEQLTADEASTVLSGNLNSVAAHARHLVVALRGSNRWAMQGEFQGDFAAAWKQQAVDPLSWELLQAELQKEVANVLSWVADESRLCDQETVLWTLSILPHCAYHLGAIRQLAALVKA